jgi:hypothetical protein
MSVKETEGDDNEAGVSLHRVRQAAMVSSARDQASA